MKVTLRRIKPYLFGENFGMKVKEKLDVGAALQKVVYQQAAKGKLSF